MKTVQQVLKIIIFSFGLILLLSLEQSLGLPVLFLSVLLYLQSQPGSGWFELALQLEFSILLGIFFPVNFGLSLLFVLSLGLVFKLLEKLMVLELRFLLTLWLGLLSWSKLIAFVWRVQNFIVYLIVILILTWIFKLLQHRYVDLRISKRIN